MDTRQLRYFVQIVESGSLSKASRQLFIVQPALSKQIARLEEEVGKPLLTRSVRGVVPTANGQALYQHAKFILRQIEEAALVARQESSQIRGRVTLGLAPSTSLILGLPLLGTLQQNYPGILLNIVVELPRHLDERARLGQMDVAILFSKTAASELVYEHLLDEQVFVLVPVGSPWVGEEKASLSLAEVAALPLVQSSTHHNIRRRIMLECERAGLEPNIVAEIDSLELVMRHVAQGGGVTLQPASAMHVVGELKQWRALPLSESPLTRPSYLFAQPVQRLSSSASVVREQVRELARSLVASGTWPGARLPRAVPATPPDPATRSG